MFQFKTLMAASAATLGASVASAAVTTSVQMQDVTTAQSDAGAPAGGTAIQFFLTSPGDILSITADVQLTQGSFYQDTTFGSDDDTPNPALFAAFPNHAVDSFITTPGASTAILPGEEIDGDTWRGSWTDLSTDGAQADFLFAQLTVSPDAVGTYSFDIAYNDGTSVPATTTVSGTIPVPEPGSLALLGLGGLALLRRRR